MKVLQIIDTLDAGGAEKMAVQIANALHPKVELSALCVTRHEGVLKGQLMPEVKCVNVRKKSTIDIFALYRAIKFCKKEGIEIIHAHGSSFFFATMLHLCMPGLGLVWHDHHGDRKNMPKSRLRILKWCSSRFDVVFSVNSELLEFSKTHLKAYSYKYLPNFIATQTTIQLEDDNILGEEGKRIVCVANLRTPKNHFALLQAFVKSKVYQDGWTLHLVGKDSKDEYATKLKLMIETDALENSVFILGQKENVESYLSNCDIGILTSTKEGLPMSILEYGKAGLAVIATNVGQIPEVLDGNGILCQSDDIPEIAQAIQTLTQKESVRKRLASSFNDHVRNTYSEDMIISSLLKTYKSIL